MSKPRILLVDDSEQNRYVLGRILRHAGLEVLDSATGSKALEMAMDNPDLIILDVKLPDISGYEVCRRLKSNPATRTTPILQISASFVTIENKVMALEGGADGYITHPVDPTVLIATVRALLRLKQAEVLMRQSAEQWQSTFDALYEGVALFDSDSRILRCNHAFAELCGLPFTDIIGSDGLELLSQRLGFAGSSVDVLSESRYICDWQHDQRWLHAGIDPVKGDGWVLVLTDITERKMAEESLRSTEKLAATGRLAHTIAHEINNPLEAVTNLIYLAQYYSESPQIKEFLAQAMGELARVARITKQVLSFNRDSSRPIELDLRELLESIISLYSRQMEDKEIQLNYKRSTPDAVMVCGFPGELRQVLANLLNNAIDASTSGSSISLRIRRRKLRGVAGASVTIGDTGPGIPRDIRKHIFEPFFTTKDLKGSGIGLWITKTIISKYRGSLRFRTSTTPGRSGTCFSLFLPLSSLSPASVREQEVSQNGRMAS